jgi:hypothetical protein
MTAGPDGTYSFCMPGWASLVMPVRTTSFCMPGWLSFIRDDLQRSFGPIEPAVIDPSRYLAQPGPWIPDGVPFRQCLNERGLRDVGRLVHICTEAHYEPGHARQFPRIATREVCRECLAAAFSRRPFNRPGQNRHHTNPPVQA